MRWLTQKQIREAAQKSPKAAKDCVIEHWTQLATCTYEELINGIEIKRVSINGFYCAFCFRRGIEGLDGAGCKPHCPVYKTTKEVCCDGTPYYEAEDAFDDFKTFSTKAVFDLFHKAAKKELAFLKTL